MARSWNLLGSVVVVAASLVVTAPAWSQDAHQHHKPEADSFVHGAPAEPTDTWTLSAGGRIYDTWWDALDRKKPETTHPAYPSQGKVSGAKTWRCAECHGWDYKGKDGVFKDGDHFTGIKGIRAAANRPVADIVKILRDKTHAYTPDMITDAELARVAAFVSRGQHDADQHIERASGNVRGDKKRGAAVFQTICAACHGFDGRMLNWGTKDEPGYVGTEANKFPAEMLHKIRNAHPGAAMINLRAFPLKDAIDVLAYARTLPVK